LGPGAAHSSSSQSHDNKKRERPHHQNFPLTENYRGQFLTTGESLARSPLTAEPANSASPVITTVRCMRHHRRRGARAERNLVTDPPWGWSARRDVRARGSPIAVIHGFRAALDWLDEIASVLGSPQITADLTF
jgi:hypothetical protein